MEDVLLPVRLIRDARIVVETARDLTWSGLESRLHPEGAPRPALAGEAVADRDGEGLALDLETELSTMTSGFTRSHDAKPYFCVGSACSPRSNFARLPDTVLA